MMAEKPGTQELETLVESVDEVETRSGKTRYVLRDADGREFTTFRPAIGREALQFKGRRARVRYSEEDRNGFHNVYLEGISEAPQSPAGSEGDTDADEAAWSTAVEAAPWVLGSREPEREVPPEELYEKLEPFKRLVADDIRKGGSDDDE
jgi:hypothetical protein